MNKKPLTDENGDVRELTRQDFKGMRRLKDVHPEIVEFMQQEAARRGRPPVDDPKRQITLRIRGSLIDALKSNGRGYMARVEKLIEEAIAKGVL
ncbi:MAG: BrnA antitoxin family protein [Alphaproteobacteria bacterium]|nr:BrnA antitoxin family protein [Alphaproteobacteria bacterium]